MCTHSRMCSQTLLSISITKYENYCHNNKQPHHRLMASILKRIQSHPRKHMFSPYVIAHTECKAYLTTVVLSKIFLLGTMVVWFFAIVVCTNFASLIAKTFVMILLHTLQRDMGYIFIHILQLLKTTLNGLIANIRKTYGSEVRYCVHVQYQWNQDYKGSVNGWMHFPNILNFLYHLSQ